MVAAPRKRGEPVFAFGVPVERTPEYAIDDCDERAHHRNTEHDTLIIARMRRRLNIGAQTVRAQCAIAPAHPFRKNGGVPCPEAPAITLNRMYHWVPSTISGESQMSGLRL